MKKLAFAATAALALIAAASASGASKPSAPAIAGPNQTTPGRHASVFSATEKGVSASKIRFRCGLDTTKLNACGRKTTLKLSDGNHVLRAQTVDPAGRKSGVTKLRISVQGVAPLLTLTTLWQKSVTSATFPHGALFGLAEGPDGDVYVADVGEDQIQVYDPAGNLVRTWGSRGKGQGQFRFEDDPDAADADIPFSGVAVDQRTGDVYVAEPSASRSSPPKATTNSAGGRSAPGTVSSRVSPT